MDQQKYLDTLKPLPIDSTFSDFRSGRMKLAWLSHTLPYVQYEVSKFAQVTEDMFINDSQRHLKRLNKTVKYALGNPVSIAIPSLDPLSLRVVGFSDASFAKNVENTTKLVYHLCF